MKTKFNTCVLQEMIAINYIYIVCSDFAVAEPY